MIFQVDVNLLYLFLLQRYISVYNDYDKKCECKTNTYNIPIPIKKEKSKLYMNGTCCSFQCLLSYLDRKKYEGDLIYNYSLNILWIILPFMINQTKFI